MDEALPIAPDSPVPQAPAVSPAAAEPQPMALTEKQRGEWKTRIDKAIEVQKKWHPWWDQAFKNYAPQVNEDPSEYALRVRTNRSFRTVQRKLADLFYQDPEVTVAPSPLIEAMPDGAKMTAAHATILRHKLGLSGVNAKMVANEALFANELCGAGWTKVFYEAYTKDVEEPVNDPMGQPVVDIDELTGIQTPRMQTVPVMIFHKCDWESYSNKQALIPADFRSTNFDRAPWLAMRFMMPLATARRKFKGRIPDDFQSTGDGKNSAQQQFFSHGGTSDAVDAKDIVTGTEIYFKSHLFRDDVPHPEHLTLLTFIDGIPVEVDYRDDPDQTLTPQGQLSPDSRIGFPYHPALTRTLTDSAYVMSDVCIGMPLTQEMDKFRDQLVRQRQINLLKFWFNTDKLPKDVLDAALIAAQGGMLGLPGSAFDSVNGPVRPFDTVPIPPSEFTADAIMSHDYDETFGIDATTSGSSSAAGVTATEANLRQANVNVRLGKEQSDVADWYVRFVTKYSTLVQRYLTVEEAAAIVGPDEARAWDQWRKTIPTRLAFVMTPDSSLKNDTPLDRKQFQDLYTYLANDPSINRQYFNSKLLEKYHLDPTRALLPPDRVPQPKPEEPSVGISFKGEDISPLMPQSPMALDILKQRGIEIDPKAFALAVLLGQKAALAQVAGEDPNAQGEQPEHGGKAAQAESLDKHASGLTGGMDGTGEMSPGMSPSGVN